MTLLYVDGFDHLNEEYLDGGYNGAYPNFKYENNGSDYGTGTGWLGSGYSIECVEAGNPTTTGYSKSIPESTTVIAGFAYKIRLLGYGTEALIRFRRGALAQVTLVINAQGYLSLRRGGRDGTVLATSSRLITQETWVYIELKVTIGSSGSFEIRMDGETVCSGSGVNTQALSDAGANCVAFGWYSSSGHFIEYYDDLYICNGEGSVNNDFLGGCRIDVITPESDGNSTQWTPSTGSNYDCVNEGVHASSNTDNVSTYTTNNLDLYNFTTLSFDPTTIRGVQLCAMGKRTSVQNRNIQLAARVNSTNYFSATQALESTDRVRVHVFETNPNTGSLWTKSEVGGAEFGIKAV